MGLISNSSERILPSLVGVLYPARAAGLGGGRGDFCFLVEGEGEGEGGGEGSKVGEEEISIISDLERLSKLLIIEAPRDNFFAGT